MKWRSSDQVIGLSRGVFRLTVSYRSTFHPIIASFFVPNVAPISNIEMSGASLTNWIDPTW